jgi:predicted DNA-binding transcriptional regulator AlpA
MLMSKVNRILLMSKESGRDWPGGVCLWAGGFVTDLVQAKDLLKLFDISRATLTRWLNPDWAAGRGISPFPAGAMKDGRTKVWNRSEVERWVFDHRHQLGRHPKPDAERYPLDRIPVVTLTLGQAFEAALRATEDDQNSFDADAFVRDLIAPIERSFKEAFEAAGVREVTWIMDEFAFKFDEGDSGDRSAVAFKLAFA